MRQLSLFLFASTMFEQGIYRSLVVMSSGRGSSSSSRMVVMVVAVVVSRSSSRPRRTHGSGASLSYTCQQKY